MKNIIINLPKLLKKFRANIRTENIGIDWGHGKSKAVITIDGKVINADSKEGKKVVKEVNSLVDEFGVMTDKFSKELKKLKV